MGEHRCCIASNTDDKIIARCCLLRSGGKFMPEADIARPRKLPAQVRCPASQQAQLELSSPPDARAARALA
ncbi:hypothetical protein KC363_g191 [Hortaea werneckii]|nr:hypothetical protein KC363_g191 [Hortaea werneckii]